MFHNIPLRILSIFKPLFTLFRIDFAVMRKIVEMKMMMDSRRVPAMFSNQMKKPKGNQFLKSLGIYVLYGVIVIPFIFGENYMFQMAIFFGIAIFILMTALISDFSTVLLDVRDKTILGTKPIDNRTISAAKLVHITIYMTMLTLAFSLIPSIVMLFTKGPLFFLLFYVSMFFIVIFILALTSLAYIVVLQFFSAERLKDIINYIQIFMSIGIVIGYQIVARSFDVVGLEVVYEFVWWHYLIPSFWFASIFELIINANDAISVIILAVSAIVIPLISITIYYILMPTFERNLEKLMEQSTSATKKKRRLSHLWERIVCFSKEEKMFFRFANTMMSEEREFKLKVYPSIGMGLIVPFLMIFAFSDGNGMEAIQGKYSFLALYFTNMIVGTVIIMLQYSGKYKGAWIFQVTTKANGRLMYSAALKALLTKLFLPVFAAVSVVFIYLFSFSIIIDVIVIFLIAFIQMIVTYQLLVKAKRPFSKPFESIQQGSNMTFLIFISMFIQGIFAGGHLILTFIPYGVIGYSIVLFFVSFFWWRALFLRKRVVVEH